MCLKKLDHEHENIPKTMALENIPTWRPIVPYCVSRGHPILAPRTTDHVERPVSSIPPNEPRQPPILKSPYSPSVSPSASP